MTQYQLRRPEEIKPGDQLRHMGKTRTVKQTRRSPGSGWILTFDDTCPLNIVSAEYVVVRRDADPLRDPMYLGLAN